MALTVTTTELATFMQDTDIDVDRATLLIRLATNLCSSVVTPVPDNADGVVLSVASRAYTNPTGVQAETIGPTTVQFGSTSGGIYLTKSDTATLNRLAGRGGGAFTVNPISPDAGCHLYPWDENLWGLPGSVDIGDDVDGFEDGTP